MDTINTINTIYPGERDPLTSRIIGCAMTVHTALGPGFLESVYQKALAHELRKASLKVECEEGLTVFYDGVSVGEFMVDMIVERSVVIENKAVRAICPAHEVQLVHYLTATNLEVGLLFNFGARSLEVRRKGRQYRPRIV